MHTKTRESSLLIAIESKNIFQSQTQQGPRKNLPAFKIQPLSNPILYLQAESGKIYFFTLTNKYQGYKKLKGQLITAIQTFQINKFTMS